jgi:hypothetical protein
MQYHRKRKIKLPNRRLHAAMHVIVENQVATNQPPTARPALRRLVKGGINRHEAVHAIGSVLSRTIYSLLKGTQPPGEDSNAKYAARLERLDADWWLNHHNDFAVLDRS